MNEFVNNLIIFSYAPEGELSDVFIHVGVVCTWIYVCVRVHTRLDYENGFLMSFRRRECLSRLISFHKLKLDHFRSHQRRQFKVQ